MDAAVRALTRLADIIVAHDVALIFACDAARDDRIPALIGAAALANLLARVYGSALPVFLKIRAAERVHLAAIDGSMFGGDGADGAGLYVMGEDAGQEDVKFVGAQDARPFGRDRRRMVVYSEGVADLQAGRLRRFRNERLVRVEVVGDSVEDECRAVAKMAAEESARQALRMESAALWGAVFGYLGRDTR